jgi:hypothetical protein
MTRPRRRRKRALTAAGWVLAAGLALAAGVLPASAQRIMQDWHTGLALYGIDPVAYHTDAKALIGRDNLEYSYGGAIWRFRNSGNRAAFTDNPEVYAPRFGGHDPMAVARGVNVPGHPDFWLIAAGGLYLFANADSRGAFAADPQKAIAAATARWPEVERLP